MEAVVKLLLIFGGMFLLAALAARLEMLVGRMMQRQSNRTIKLLEMNCPHCIPACGVRVKFWCVGQSGRPTMVIVHAASRADLAEIHERLFPAGEPVEIAANSEIKHVPTVCLCPPPNFPGSIIIC